MEIDSHLFNEQSGRRDSTAMIVTKVYRCRSPDKATILVFLIDHSFLVVMDGVLYHGVRHADMAI